MSDETTGQMFARRRCVILNTVELETGPHTWIIGPFANEKSAGMFIHEHKPVGVCKIEPILTPRLYILDHTDG